MKALVMTDGELSRAFRLAKDPVMMVTVLAELNDVGTERMKRKLRSLGCVIPEPEKEIKSGSCWSREEDERLAELMDEGCSTAAAAARLPGRSAKSVYNRWRRLQAVYLAQRRLENAARR